VVQHAAAWRRRLACSMRFVSLTASYEGRVAGCREKLCSPIACGNADGLRSSDHPAFCVVLHASAWRRRLACSMRFVSLTASYERCVAGCREKLCSPIACGIADGLRSSAHPTFSGRRACRRKREAVGCGEGSEPHAAWSNMPPRGAGGSRAACGSFPSPHPTEGASRDVARRSSLGGVRSLRAGQQSVAMPAPLMTTRSRPAALAS
jgi:hypothetical protein